MRAGVSLVFGGAGIYMLWLTVLLARRRLQWRRDGVVVDGEIVGLKERRPRGQWNEDQPTFAPVVGFRRENGELSRFTSSESSSRSPYRVGQKVRVRYLPSDPKSVDLDGVTRSWMPLVVVMTLAAMCLVGATLPFVLTPEP